MVLAIGEIQWFMKSNSSADRPSINNMKTDSDDHYRHFYIVKARFKNCIFSSWIYFDFVFVSFDNCSFYGYTNMDALNYLFGLGYNITHVFLIRCTVQIVISGRYASNDVLHTLSLMLLLRM